LAGEIDVMHAELLAVCHANRANWMHQAESPFKMHGIGTVFATSPISLS
jgi:hypothetical protein